jgi:hypothetical protein
MKNTKAFECLILDFPVRIWNFKKPITFWLMDQLYRLASSTSFQYNSLFAYSIRTYGKFCSSKKFTCTNNMRASVPFYIFLIGTAVLHGFSTVFQLHKEAHRHSWVAEAISPGLASYPFITRVTVSDIHKWSPISLTQTDIPMQVLDADFRRSICTSHFTRGGPGTNWTKARAWALLSITMLF